MVYRGSFKDREMFEEAARLMRHLTRFHINDDGAMIPNIRTLSMGEEYVALQYDLTKSRLPFSISIKLTKLIHNGILMPVTL